MRSARVARAMSRSRLTILSTRTPLAGNTSYRVMVGPRVMSPRETEMPNCIRVSMMTSWMESSSSGLAACRLE